MVKSRAKNFLLNPPRSPKHENLLNPANYKDYYGGKRAATLGFDAVAWSIGLVRISAIFARSSASPCLLLFLFLVVFGLFWLLAHYGAVSFFICFSAFRLVGLGVYSLCIGMLRLRGLWLLWLILTSGVSGIVWCPP